MHISSKLFSPSDRAWPRFWALPALQLLQRWLGGKGDGLHPASLGSIPTGTQLPIWVRKGIWSKLLTRAPVKVLTWCLGSTSLPALEQGRQRRWIHPDRRTYRRYKIARNSFIGALTHRSRKNMWFLTENRCLSGKRYEISPWLLWTTNRKS